MGQGSSKVVVHVQLDGAYYYAGDTVTGAVVLHVEHPIEVKGVCVKVTGVEKTKWIERRQSSTPAHDVTYHGKHVMFKHKLPLSGAGTIKPGGYQWPISFQLPPNIPGTFHYDAPDHRAKASIEYKIKATVDQEGFFKSDFKKTLRFDVLQRNKLQAPSGPVLLNTDVPISAWCCFNKGHINLQAATDTDSFLPGQSIHVNAQVDNKTSTPVTLVEVKLHQRLHLMAESFLGQINKHIDVVRVLSRQQALNGTGGAAGLLSQYQARLDLSQGMEATCMGKVIRSTYELEVTAKTGCCLSEASLKHPIFINDPQPHTAPPAVVPPPGWAPQMHPTVVFQVPAPDYYAAWQPPTSGTPVQPEQPVPQQYTEQHQCNQPSYKPAPPGQWNQPQPEQLQPYQPPQAHTPYQQQYQPAYDPSQQAPYCGAPPAADQYGQPGAFGAPAVAAQGAICYVGQQQQQQQQVQQYVKQVDAWANPVGQVVSWPQQPPVGAPAPGAPGYVQGQTW